jgi:hypothetical protein
MPRSILAAALALTVLQPSGQPYAGIWIAEFSGTTHIRLELRLNNGGLSGGISLGDIEVDAKGDLRTAAAAPRELAPIIDVMVREGTLSFSRKDDDETDRMEMRLVGDQAELRFILSDADRQELAESGIAVPKPIRLKRISP